MKIHTPEDRLPQPIKGSLKTVLLRCVDMAESPSDAKSMILTMYESDLLSCAETFSQIAVLGLQSA